MTPTQEERLRRLLGHPRIWRAGEDREHDNVIPSGHHELDGLLPGGGWPAAALSEILLDRYGLGELRLLLPTLVRLSNHDDGRRIVWVAPPYIPYAPALAAAGVNVARLLVVHTNTLQHTLWAAEQALRSGSCAAVLVWARRAPVSELRRLQLAAVEGAGLGALFRPCEEATQPSPAALRIALRTTREGPRLHILKCRGGRPATLQADFLSLGAARTRAPLPNENSGARPPGI